MTLVNVKGRPVNGHFNNLMNDFFAPLPSILKEEFSAGALKHSAPVNVIETEAAFVLEVIAPGFSKEEISITLENNLLTIAGEKKSEKDANTGKMIRTEYQYGTFRRSFSLNKQTDAEAITANFENGVLLLNLPKKAEVKTTKNITIQ